MAKTKLSENITFALAFLSGVIFGNSVGLVLQGNYIMAIFSLMAIGVAVLLKNFVDWSTEE
jgi:hypothetical protein